MREQMQMIDREFTKATPESQGIKSESIIKLMDTILAAGIELHSLYVVRNGKLVAGGNAKPFTSKSYHRTQSAAKTIVSTAMLFAIQEDIIGLDDKVIDYFPEYLPEGMDEKFKSLTVYHLLTMSTGHAEDTFSRMMDSDNWIKTFFSIPLQYEPGTFWMYNNGVPHILGCMIKQATGQHVSEFLKPRLLEPLDMDMLFGFNEQGEFDSAVTCITPETFVKFALLYLQEGEWEGKRILDRELIQMAGSALVSNAGSERVDKDSRAGYGFQIWRNAAGGYRMAGGGGQYAMIFPEASLAVVTMCFSPIYHRIPEFITDCLYHQMYERPLPENPDMLKELNYKLENFSLAPTPASASSSRCAELSGKVFRFDKNSIGLEKFCIEFMKDKAMVKFTQDGQASVVPCAFHGEWAEYEGNVIVENDYSMFSRIYGYDLGRSLVSGGWIDNNKFQLNIRSHASMGTGTIICDYRFDTLTLTIIPARLRGRNPKTKEVIPFKPITLTAKTSGFAL